MSGSVYETWDHVKVDGRWMIFRYDPGREYSLLNQLTFMAEGPGGETGEI
jgi:hypothetical protein